MLGITRFGLAKMKESVLMLASVSSLEFCHILSSSFAKQCKPEVIAILLLFYVMDLKLLMFTDG